MLSVTVPTVVDLTTAVFTQHSWLPEYLNDKLPGNFTPAEVYRIAEAFGQTENQTRGRYSISLDVGDFRFCVLSGEQGITVTVYSLN